MIALECKWSARDFDLANLKAIARAYPKAQALVVATDAQPAFRRDNDGLRVDFVPLSEAIRRLTGL